MIGRFRFDPTPVSTLFGYGCANELGLHFQELGVSSVLVCLTKGGFHRHGKLLESAGDCIAAIFAGAEPHNPETVAEAALGEFRKSGADGVAVIGGGSTIGLAKYIKVKTGAPALIIPTTYSGSEQTPIYGVKIGDEKRTWVDPACMPDLVVYDPDLTLHLPASETVTTGMNGLAHCVEALYFKNPGPLVTGIARQGIAAYREGLLGSIKKPADIDARSKALYGGFIGGLMIQMAGIALHHRICHVLGGLFDIPHGESNAVILPYAVAYNARAAEPAMRIIREEFQAEDAAAAIYDFAKSLGAPASLREIGMPKNGIERAAKGTLETLKYNPREGDLASLSILLESAYEGRKPSEGAF